MFKAIEVSIDTDLSQFSRMLWQRRLSHRILRIQDVQILAVSKPDQVREVESLYRQWLAGTVQVQENDSSDLSGYFSGQQLLGRMGAAFRDSPVTLLLIVICCVLAVVAPLTALSDTVRLFLYPDFSYGTRTINLSRVIDNFTAMQFFNMISPMLLHAGLIHLSFNMLWLWEFGKRIEAVQPSWSMLLLVVVLALISNTAQYLVGGGIYFGGMSGVVYGLLGYIWMWQLFDPRKGLGLPPALVFFMLLALVILTMIGLENIADTAHLAGLLAGVVYGAVLATISRVRRAVKETDN